MTKRQNLTGIINALEKETDGPRISFEDILKALENRGFGPLLLAPAIILVLPTGALPGIPIVCGAFITFVSMQLALGLPNFLIPESVLSFSMDRRKFTTAIHKAQPVTRWIDRFIHPRLEILVNPFTEKIVAIICAILGIIIMAVGIVPFGVTLPALAIIFFALGLSGKDGFLLAGGFICLAGAIGAAIMILQK